MSEVIEIETTAGPNPPGTAQPSGMGPIGSTVWCRVTRHGHSTGWRECLGVMSIIKAGALFHARPVADAWEQVTRTVWPMLAPRLADGISAFLIRTGERPMEIRVSGFNVRRLRRYDVAGGGSGTGETFMGVQLMEQDDLGDDTAILSWSQPDEPGWSIARVLTWPL